MSKLSFFTRLVTTSLALVAFSPSLAFATDSNTNDTLSSDPNFSCADLKIVFARHSGAELGELNYRAYVRSFVDTFADTGLSISSYELGSHPGGYAGYSYPSPGIGIHTWERFTTSLGAVVSAGNSYAFGESVKEGAAEAVYFISNYKQLCPNSKVILGGFSQGAQVVSLALQGLNPDDIFQAHTFGDPKLYLPEGTPAGTKTSSRACREGRATYSYYRAFVPDCYVYEGVLGGYRPYDPYLSAAPAGTPAAEVPLATLALAESSPYKNKIKAYCQHHDIICSAYVDLAHLAYGHATYRQQGSYKKAAEEVYNAVFPLQPGESPRYNQPIQNVAILLDNTASMNSHYAYYLSEVLKVAKKYLEHGDKLALYTYRDLATSPDKTDPYFDTPRKICDFETCSLDAIPDLLKSIYFDSGGDDPESVLSAAYTLMSELNWTDGANKSVIVITDASFHSPDHDGITLDDVVTLSEEIDPVNFYFFIPNYLYSDYLDFATRTNGGVYPMGKLEAFALLNQEIANRLGDYGMFAETPDLEFSEVTSLTASAPTWLDLPSNSSLSPDTAIKISYSLTRNTRLLLLTVNEEISGYLEPRDYNDYFLVTDLDRSQDNQLCLSPVSIDGYRSPATCIILSADENSENPTPAPVTDPENDPEDNSENDPENPSADTPSTSPEESASTTPVPVIPKAPNTGYFRHG